MPGFILTEDDRTVLTKVIGYVKRLVANPRQLRGESDEEEPGFSMDAYVARVPSGGIAGLTLESGTGTGVQDIPGSAVCELYHLQPTGPSSSLELRRISGLTRRVYNLSIDSVPGNSWVMAIKAKSGHWFACDPAGSEGGTGTGGGGGGTTIGVEAVDGTPDYATIDTLRFDEADGFALSNPVAGVARIDISAATTSQAGIVSTGSQTFAGDKQFNGRLIGARTSTPQLEGGSTSGTIGTGIMHLGTITGGGLDVTAICDSSSSVGGRALFNVSSGGTSHPNSLVLQTGTYSYTVDTGITLFSAGRIMTARKFAVNNTEGTGGDGVDGTFTDLDGNVVTVLGGIIIGITPP